MSIVVANASILSKRIKDFSAAKLRIIEKEMPEIALDMEGEVKESIAGHRAEPTSVDTGQFLNSPVGTTPDPFTAQVASNVEHGIYLELGTSKMAARHHFEHSLRRSRKIAVDRLTDKLKS